jgi:hypothetical protein
MDNLTGARWIKSSYSGTNGGGCVEVARNLADVVAVRDSKDPEGGVLVLGREAFAALTAGIRAGDFDLA